MRRHDVAVAVGQPDDQVRHVLGQPVAVFGGVGDQNLRDAVDRGGRLGDPAAAFTGNQHMDVAADGRGRGDGVQRRRLQLGIVVFG